MGVLVGLDLAELFNDQLVSRCSFSIINKLVRFGPTSCLCIYFKLEMPFSLKVLIYS